MHRMVLPKVTMPREMEYILVARNEAAFRRTHAVLGSAEDIWYARHRRELEVQRVSRRLVVRMLLGGDGPELWFPAVLRISALAHLLVGTELVGAETSDGHGAVLAELRST